MSNLFDDNDKNESLNTKLSNHFGSNIRAKEENIQEKIHRTSSVASIYSDANEVADMIYNDMKNNNNYDVVQFHNSFNAFKDTTLKSISDPVLRDRARKDILVAYSDKLSDLSTEGKIQADKNSFETLIAGYNKARDNAILSAFNDPVKTDYHYRKAMDFLYTLQQVGMQDAGKPYIDDILSTPTVGGDEGEGKLKISPLKVDILTQATKNQFDKVLNGETVQSKNYITETGSEKEFLNELEFNVVKPEDILDDPYTFLKNYQKRYVGKEAIPVEDQDKLHQELLLRLSDKFFEDQEQVIKEEDLKDVENISIMNDVQDSFANDTLSLKEVTKLFVDKKIPTDDYFTYFNAVSDTTFSDAKEFRDILENVPFLSVHDIMNSSLSKIDKAKVVKLKTKENIFFDKENNYDNTDFYVNRILKSDAFEYTRSYAEANPTQKSLVKDFYNRAKALPPELRTHDNFMGLADTVVKEYTQKKQQDKATKRKAMQDDLTAKAKAGELHPDAHLLGQLRILTSGE